MYNQIKEHRFLMVFNRGAYTTGTYLETNLQRRILLPLRYCEIGKTFQGMNAGMKRGQNS